MTALDQDKASLVLPRRRPAAAPWQPVVRWALAASVVLVAGFLAGRASGPSRAEIQRQIAAVKQEVRTDLQAQLREDLKAVAAGVETSARENQRLLADFSRDLQSARAADRRDLMAVLDALDRQRATDTEALRAGLYTLARRTGTSFQQTESQLNLLAANLPVTATPASLSNNSPIENKP